jgi:NAD/NADP transhydrogenase alpha subunit
MERIRIDNGLVPSNPRAMVPYGGQQATRGIPVRTRSMPLNNNNSRSSKNSLAMGGVAVLDPKKDKRKATRKMKTAAGTVGGAVVGGLILGPVGVVLGAGGGAAVTNKMAKSRDKRKQQQFEQKNFQKGASESTAAKGDGAFA